MIAVVGVVVVVSFTYQLHLLRQHENMQSWLQTYGNKSNDLVTATPTTTATTNKQCCYCLIIASERSLASFVRKIPFPWHPESGFTIKTDLLMPLGPNSALKHIELSRKYER